VACIFVLLSNKSVNRRLGSFACFNDSSLGSTNRVLSRIATTIDGIFN